MITSVIVGVRLEGTPIPILIAGEDGSRSRADRPGGRRLDRSASGA